jgi:hypothetical protein
MEGWIQTYTGRHFDLNNPSADDIELADIAHHLSNLCRYTGAGSFYSVAQHSVLVSFGVRPRNALWGLLHDASEAYVNDISAPLKALPEFAGYRRIEKKIMVAVANKFGLPWPEPAEVKVVDRLMLRTEARDLGLISPDWECYSMKPLDMIIEPMTPKEAEVAFLDRFCDLTIGEGKFQGENILLHRA